MEDVVEYLNMEIIFYVKTVAIVAHALVSGERGLLYPQEWPVRPLKSFAKMTKDASENGFGGY